MASTYPTIVDKYRYPSVTGAADFLEAAKAAGWDPGPLPEGVVFNFSPVLTQRLDEESGRFRENPSLAPSNSRFFMTADDGPPVGISCLCPGATAMATQALNLSHLGVSRFLIIGTAGGLDPAVEPGHVVLVTAAVRDEGVSHHFLAPSRYADPSTELMGQLRDALDRRAVSFVEGRSWTTAIPYRVTTPELQAFTSEGVIVTEMEAAALFAVATALGAQAAAVVTLTDLTTTEGRVKEDWRATVEPLNELLEVSIDAIRARF